MNLNIDIPYLIVNVNNNEILKINKPMALIIKDVKEKKEIEYQFKKVSTLDENDNILIIAEKMPENTRNKHCVNLKSNLINDIETSEKHNLLLKNTISFLNSFDNIVRTNSKYCS